MVVFGVVAFGVPVEGVVVDRAGVDGVVADGVVVEGAVGATVDAAGVVGCVPAAEGAAVVGEVPVVGAVAVVGVVPVVGAVVGVGAVAPVSKYLMAPSTMAMAYLSWPSAPDNAAASAGFDRLPSSAKTSGTFVRLTAAMSARVCSPSCAPA